MGSKTISLDVSFSQVAVFVSALKQPFNDWTDRHVAQGFAWRIGSVSFRTLFEAGFLSVEIDVVEHAANVDVDVVRAIEVPFEVPADGEIEVASISDSVSLSIPSGTYLLRCELLKPIEHTGKMRLIFARKDIPHFAVIRADEHLSVDDELLKTAQPA